MNPSATQASERAAAARGDYDAAKSLAELHVAAEGRAAGRYLFGLCLSACAFPDLHAQLALHTF